MSKEIDNFNKKYQTEIALDKPEIDVLNKKIGNEGLKQLCSFKFTNLEQLLLEENGITNIDMLASNKFGDKLTAIDFSTNKLKSIDILVKCNFPALIHLFLNSNQLTSIDVLAKVKFPLLKELNLSANKIKSIDILGKVNFPALKELDLSKNEISNIDILGHTKFPELSNLYLEQNKITSIDILGKFNCNKLEKLKLEKNKLKSIDILTKVDFSSLTYLSVGDDTIWDKVDCLTKVNFKVLEDLYLYLNDSINRETKKIQDIITYFEEKKITFNFISCDDDNGAVGVTGVEDDLDLCGSNFTDCKSCQNNTMGFESLLDNENLF